MDYFNEAMKRERYVDYGWLLNMFAVSGMTTKDDYDIVRDDDGVGYWVGGERVVLDVHIDRPIYNPITSVKLEILLCNKEPIETTYGIAVANALLLYYPFGDKIDYINKEFYVNDVEKIIVPLLKNKTITVKELIKFKKAAKLIGKLSSVIVHSATKKNIVPPTGLAAYKKKLLAEYKKKGLDVNDPLVGVDLTEKLQKFDEEYMSDDPSWNIYVSKKVKDLTRVKVYMAYGNGKAWNSTTDLPYLTNSLSEGAVNTPEELSIQNNSVRTASYSRGTEIILGGVTATLTTRILSHLSVAPKDCGTKDTIKVAFRAGESSKYLGRTVIDRGKVILLNSDNINKYEGTYINLRSIITCKNILMCSVCCGKNMADNPKSIGMFGFGLSSKVVKASLKAFHSTKLTSVNLDYKDIR